MIYLIKTAVFIEGKTEDLDKIVLALKLGYSRDERGKGRFEDYKTGGLTYRIIKTILGGSYKLENLLHHLFSNYRIPSRSKEWFYYHSEIVNVIEACNSETDLYRLFGVENEEDLLSKELKSKSESYKINYELSQGIQRFKSTHKILKDNKIYELLLTFQKLLTFPDRMKMVCTLLDKNVDENELNSFLTYIPQIFEKFYRILGPKRISELSYRRDNLKAEYDKLVNNQKVEVLAREKITEFFLIGEKYTNSWVKAKLKEIYLDIGLNKTAKAKDIEDYFEVSTCNIQRAEDPLKYDKGYLILSLKVPRNEQNSD